MNINFCSSFIPRFSKAPPATVVMNGTFFTSSGDIAANRSGLSGPPSRGRKSLATNLLLMNSSPSSFIFLTSTHLVLVGASDVTAFIVSSEQNSNMFSSSTMYLTSSSLASASSFSPFPVLDDRLVGLQSATPIFVHQILVHFIHDRLRWHQLHDPVDPHLFCQWSPHQSWRPHDPCRYPA